MTVATVCSSTISFLIVKDTNYDLKEQYDKENNKYVCEIIPIKIKSRGFSVVQQHIAFKSSFIFNLHFFSFFGICYLLKKLSKQWLSRYNMAYICLLPRRKINRIFDFMNRASFPSVSGHRS